MLGCWPSWDLRVMLLPCQIGTYQVLQESTLGFKLSAPMVDVCAVILVSLLRGFLWGRAWQEAQGAKQKSSGALTGVECIHTSHACKGKPKERHIAPHQEWPCSLMPSGCLALPSDHFQLEPMQATWPCECMVACMCVDTLINHGKHRHSHKPGLAWAVHEAL